MFLIVDDKGELSVEKLINGKVDKSMEEFQVIENCLMIKLPEEVDHHRAGYISERADCLIAQSAVEHVVFDFEDTQFMDSSGIGIIAGRYKQIACLGGKVYAIHANPQILRMLTLSGLNKLVVCDYK